MRSETKSASGGKNSLLIIAGLVVLGVGGYQALSGGLPMGNPTLVEDEVPAEVEEDLVEVPAESDEEEMGSEEEILAESVKEAIVDRRGGDPNDLEVTVDTIDGDYASGGARNVGAVAGGGMWFAAKVDGKWELVWDGNGTIMCSDLKNYPNFPGRMIPECYDEEAGKLIAR